MDAWWLALTLALRFNFIDSKDQWQNHNKRSRYPELYAEPFDSTYLFGTPKVEAARLVSSMIHALRDQHNLYDTDLTKRTIETAPFKATSIQEEDAKSSLLLQPRAFRSSRQKHTSRSERYHKAAPSAGRVAKLGDQGKDRAEDIENAEDENASYHRLSDDSSQNIHEFAEKENQLYQPGNFTSHSEDAAMNENDAQRDNRQEAEANEISEDRVEKVQAGLAGSSQEIPDEQAGNWGPEKQDATKLRVNSKTSVAKLDSLDRKTSLRKNGKAAAKLDKEIKTASSGTNVSQSGSQVKAPASEAQGISANTVGANPPIHSSSIGNSSSLPIPSMIPIPLFYNSGDGEGSASSENQSLSKDISLGEDFLDPNFIDSSGSGGEWVDKILTDASVEREAEDEQMRKSSFDNSTKPLSNQTASASNATFSTTSGDVSMSSGLPSISPAVVNYNIPNSYVPIMNDYHPPITAISSGPYGLDATMPGSAPVLEQSPAYGYACPTSCSRACLPTCDAACCNGNSIAPQSVLQFVPQYVAAAQTPMSQQLYMGMPIPILATSKASFSQPPNMWGSSAMTGPPAPMATFISTGTQSLPSTYAFPQATKNVPAYLQNSQNLQVSGMQDLTAMTVASHHLTNQQSRLQSCPVFCARSCIATCRKDCCRAVKRGKISKRKRGKKRKWRHHKRSKKGKRRWHHQRGSRKSRVLKVLHQNKHTKKIHEKHL